MSIYLEGDSLTVTAGDDNFGQIFSGQGTISYTQGSNSVTRELLPEQLPFAIEDGSVITVEKGWVDMALLSSGVPRGRSFARPNGTIFPENSLEVTSARTAQSGSGYALVTVTDNTDSENPVVVLDKAKIRLDELNYPFQMSYFHSNHTVTWEMGPGSSIVYSS